MKLLIAGAGAIGGWLGGLLAANHDVTLLGRQPLADAVAAHGLRVSGHTELAVHPRVITEPAGSFDAAFLTCKAHATSTVAQRIAPHVTGPIVSLQNGLGNAEKLTAIFGPDRVAVALTSHGVKVDGPGRLVHAGLGTTTVGPAPGTDPTDDADGWAFDVLRAAGLEPRREASMRGHIWQKAIINAGVNPVAALHDVANGALLDGPLAALSAGLVQEATQLAARARVTLPSDDLVAVTRRVCENTRQNLCSMVQDVRARRPTEMEQITGRMVRLAEQLLVSMPRNESVYGRMKDLEASYLGHEASEALAWNELHAPGPV